MKKIDEQLLLACTESFDGFEKIHKLLEEGANPLGKVINKFGDPNNLYDSVFEYCYDGEIFVRLTVITELFCRYGMVISSPEVPYDDSNIINPLWSFAFYGGGQLLSALKILLDHGLDKDSAGECWGHALTDLYHCDGELTDDLSYEMLYDTIRKTLLIASYPHILDNDKDLRDFIWFSNNTYDVQKFRDWDEYYFEIDTSRCYAAPEAYRSLVTVKEMSTGHPVWKFGFGLNPEDIQ